MPKDSDSTKARVIDSVCQALTLGDREQASAIAKVGYPFAPTSNAGRSYSEYQMTQTFARDGFVDRYSGARLIFPGTLRLLSTVMPEEFPTHANWKMSECHAAYWELFPTIDHIVPVARGGSDDASNWVTTSMLHNSAKGNWTLGELGWLLQPPGHCEGWDGLMRWFLTYAEKHSALAGTACLRRWRAAAVKVIAA
jgi:hypothetical protein